jgi:ABC-type sugar transport system ATPase subunit
MKAIEVQNLIRNYNGLRAVDGISFNVKPGEIFGFLGPNGAGKTTTIRMLTGQLLPTSGSAKVAGYDIVTERQQLKPRIGVVFEARISMSDSARENLICPPYQSRKPANGCCPGRPTRRRQGPKYSNGMKKGAIARAPQADSPVPGESTRPNPHTPRDIRRQPPSKGHDRLPTPLHGGG